MSTNTNPQGSVAKEGQPKMTTREAFKALLEPQKEPTIEAESEEQETSQEEIVDQEQQEVQELSDESQDQVEEQGEGEEQGEAAESVGVDLTSLVKAKINGEEKEITVQEAIQGYQRLEDYTRGKQEVARQRTQLASEITAYQQGIEIVAKYVFAEAEAFRQLDWDKLKASDPQKWSATKIEAQEAYERAKQLAAEWKSANSKAQELLAANVAEQLPQEHKKLAEKVEGWGDPEKQKTIKSKWAEYGTSQGFTLEELQGVIDHRMLVVLNKAMQFDELMAKQKGLKTKKVTDNPRVVVKKTGANTNLPAKADRAMVDAMNRQARTGSREATQEVFKLRLQQQLKGK